jgi:hypothetical protein
MAANILIGKTRFTSRSDREREKLQAQISTYAIRHNADSAERELASKRALGIEDAMPKRTGFHRLESWIEKTIALVDNTLAPGSVR